MTTHYVVEEVETPIISDGFTAGIPLDEVDTHGMRDTLLVGILSAVR